MVVIIWINRKRKIIMKMTDWMCGRSKPFIIPRSKKFECLFFAHSSLLCNASKKKNKILITSITIVFHLLNYDGPANYICCWADVMRVERREITVTIQLIHGNRINRQCFHCDTRSVCGAVCLRFTWGKYVIIKMNRVLFNSFY